MKVEFEDDPRTIVNVGGRWTHDVTVHMDDDTASRIAQGYLCLKCLEPQSEAFPEVCSLRGCGYRMRENQRRDWDAQYVGLTDLNQELPGKLDLSERAKAAGIWIPGS